MGDTIIPSRRWKQSLREGSRWPKVTQLKRTPLQLGFQPRSYATGNTLNCLSALTYHLTASSTLCHISPVPTMGPAQARSGKAAFASRPARALRPKAFMPQGSSLGDFLSCDNNHTVPGSRSLLTFPFPQLHLLIPEPRLLN